MNVFAYVAMLLGGIAILGETIYAHQQTKDNARLSREDFLVYVWIGTMVGIFFFSLGAFMMVYNNYDEKAVRRLLIISVGVSMYIALMSIGIAGTRLRNATSS